jgi:hypothetical protein
MCIIVVYGVVEETLMMMNDERTAPSCKVIGWRSPVNFDRAKPA